MSTFIKKHAAAVSLPKTAPAEQTTRRSVGRLVFGGLSLLLALALIGSAIAAIFALENNRDGSGYFITHTHHYQTSSYALSTENLNVGGVGGTLESGLLRLRITATSTDTAKPLFIGIARTTDLNHYLAGVAHEELRDFSFDPFKVNYRPFGRGAPKALPSSQTFWRTKASGTGTQAISWAVKGGHWSAVVMNANGSRNVSVNAQLAARLSGAWWFVAAMIGLGAISLLGGVALVRSGSARKHALEPTPVSEEISR